MDGPNRSTPCARRQGRPAWWALDGLAALVIVVVGLVDAAVAEGRLREVLELVAVALGFALIHRWVRRNGAALDRQGRRRWP